MTEKLNNCCGDSPFPIYKAPKLVSSKFLKKMLGKNTKHKGGGIINSKLKNFLKNNIIMITIIGLVILFLLFKYLKKRKKFKNESKINKNITTEKKINKNISNNELKEKEKKDTLLIKVKKEGFKPMSS
jgi:hypothetical protein